MKISRNWLNNYLVSNKTNEELVDLFTQLGLECTYQQIKSLPNDIVVGKVNTCSKHPNADRLKVCTVDIGNNEIVDIVCGAPNIDKNLVVPVAKVGSTINDFKIKKAKIRDVVSNGMICSGKELNLNDDHDGIMILDENFVPGEPLSDVLNLEDNTIFDFEITPNRGDCLGHIGIARELSIIEKNKSKVKNYIQKKYQIKENNETLTINIDNDKCKRYTACIIRNITVKESPAWLKKSLESIGQKSINNIVDAANFILMDLGHPMHTFDLDKIKSNSINVRSAKKNETIITLDDCKQKLSSDNLLICDGNNPVAIAGIIGGNNSGVDENTKHILIESAYFDPINIRKSSKFLGISTEASKRFERDTDINMLIPALNKLVFLIKDVAGGEISSKFFDIYDNKFGGFDSKGILLLDRLRTISFDVNECNKFLGVNLSNKDVDKIFDVLNIKFANKRNIYKCRIPTYRNDIESSVDLYEEIARVYGYNNIPSSINFSFSVNSIEKDKEVLDNKIRSILSSNGFNEHYSNSLYSKSDTDIDRVHIPLKLINPLSNDMEYLRNSLLPGLLRATSFNEKRGHNVVKLFELGSINSFNKKKFNKTDQYKDLILLWTEGEIKHWNSSDSQNIFTIKGEIEHLFNMLNIKRFNFKSSKTNTLNLCVGDKIVGYLKEVSKKIRVEYDIKSNIYISNINLDLLDQLYNDNNINYKKINSFPSINRDISILINTEYTNQDIENIIYKYGGNKLFNLELFDIYNDEKISTDSISMAYSLTFKSNNKTLTDKEVDGYMDIIIKNLKNKLNVIQR